ncbi:MAG: alpha/beta hydrolase [Bryobacterales bacterium]|nr:alpha/beta hydrolase [Bryobacterales bacterium]
MITLSSVLLAFALFGADPAGIPLYPSEKAVDKEESRIGPGDNHRRIANVTRPTMMPFLPANGNGAAVIILPGGGFRHLAIDKEGTDVARWLNTMGVAGFVVKYRVMVTDHTTPADREVAQKQGVEDTLAAIRMVRARAAEWKLDAAKIGVMGFSAGGYHAASAALHFTNGETRPDFAVCVYPAAPQDLTVPKNAPPVLLIHADDDRLAPSANSVPIYLALKKAGIPAAMHIFARGGHGFGMTKSGAPTDRWTDRAAEWMQGLWAGTTNR